MRYFFLFCTMLFLASCSNETQPIESPPTEKQTNELQLFFKEDGSTAFFEGEGNEFASYTEQTFWLSSDYVHVRIDNGGATINKVYRITGTAIELIFQEVEDVAQFDEAALDTYQVISTLLKAPIDIGQSEDNWTITDTSAPIDTPYRTFDDAIVIVKEVENITETNYYVRGYGLVKSVTEMVDGDEAFVVSSTLKELEVE
ncbi:hypothetical protein [Metasolibacillus sp.]|uniref:hypothetical protein n=1 Tax=Metasolibacillus sp. TaxID=2703680 RepID=UPI0025CF3F09|nr:hypothetical protein [Metasolibacillus sp.]MCT6925355.1 hypothetical protein [Metasolibacillus sp.]MCT6941617.1 hypothetical protein [Metasolibacillus sp.]